MIAPMKRAGPRVLAIDPGSAQSGVVLYDPVASSPVIGSDVLPNEQVLRCLKLRSLPMDDDGRPASLSGPHVLAVEFPVAQGMPASNELFVTVEWIGRFREAWGGEFVHVARPAVKLHLCGQSRAKDGNVRAAIIDRFGGETALEGQTRCEACKGRKRAKVKDGGAPCASCNATGRWGEVGPLYGVSSHAWPALAVAITYIEAIDAATRGGVET